MPQELDIQTSHQLQGLLIGCHFTRNFCHTSAMADLQMRMEICLYGQGFVYSEWRYGNPKQAFFVPFHMCFVLKTGYKATLNRMPLQNACLSWNVCDVSVYCIFYNKAKQIVAKRFLFEKPNLDLCIAIHDANRKIISLQLFHDTSLGIWNQDPFLR